MFEGSNNFDPEDYPLQRKLYSFEEISDRWLGVFESSVKEIDESIRKRLANLEAERPEISKQLQSLEFKDESDTPDGYIELWSDLEINQYETLWAKAQLLSLSEMKIVFLYKSLEITIKKLMTTVEPTQKFDKLNFTGLIDAANMRLGVKINSLVAYKEMDELREVNNAIKHSGEISAAVALISEFKGCAEFTFENLESFYKRIYPLVDKFISSMGKEISRISIERHNNSKQT